MERYRLRPSSNPNLSQTLSIQTNPPFHISFPPKTPITRRLSDAADDAEISIFDAERYFNETCESSINPRDFTVSSVDGYTRNYRTRSFRSTTTPTLSSEASWNSRSGLLKNPPGSVSVSVRAFPLNEKRKNGLCRRFFCRNCPCYGKKSVDVEEKIAESKSPVRVSSDKVSTKESVEKVAKLKLSAGIWPRDSKCISPEIGHRIVNSGRPFIDSSGFSFTVLSPPPPLATSGDDDPARESLEVFRQADATAKMGRSAEFLRRMPAVVACDDDIASDTSSDLFEIESFATNSAYCRRDSLDEFPRMTRNSVGIRQYERSVDETTVSVAPSECYPPSEVSIVWSVTTAEGGFDRTSVANFSSAASDCSDARFSQTEDERYGATKVAGNGGGNRKNAAGGLLSCRCENSVNVGPNPVRIGSEQLRVEPDRRLGMSRFGLENADLVGSKSGRMNRTVQIR